jgi:hypothetical protein
MGMDDWHYKWTEQFGYHLEADTFIKFFALYLEPQRIFSEETLSEWAKVNYNQEPCKWKHNPDEFADLWETECGQSYDFDGFSPKDNNYCPNCGKPLEFIEEEECTEKEDDDI